MNDPTRTTAMADAVATAADAALDALDAAAADLAATRAIVAAWAVGEPARGEPSIYGNRWCDAVDAVATFRATVNVAGRVGRIDRVLPAHMRAAWADAFRAIRP